MQFVTGLSSSGEAEFAKTYQQLEDMLVCMSSLRSKYSYWPMEPGASTRVHVQAVQERLRVVEENASFEIGALFLSLYRRVKKRGNFRTCIFFV